MRGRLSRAALVLLALAGTALAEEPAPPPAAPASVTVADFDGIGDAADAEFGGSVVDRVADGPDGTNHALRWAIRPEGKSAFLILAVPASPDRAKARSLRFRIRREGPSPGRLLVRLENGREVYLEARVRGTGPEWTAVAIDLDAMEAEGNLDPAKIDAVEFIVFGPSEGVFLIDDLALDPAPAPGPAAEDPKKGEKPTGKGARRVVVADFEREGSEEWVDAYGSGAVRAPAGGKEKGSVLSWTTKAGKRVSYIEVHGGPRDVRAFRRLRFRVRADREVAEELSVRFETTVDDYLGGRCGAIGKAWKSVEVVLPELRTQGAFDPARVRDISFLFFDPVDATVQVDDLVLEEGAGGWKFTPEEMIARVFGDDRVRKVKRIPTRHFDIHTDSTAASSKFPGALEKAYDFVKKTLGHAEMEERLPIYIFQSSELYFDFCVRFCGWSRRRAEDTAGHGSGRYFATYYQSPEAPTVIHELTHSIFHRTVGAWGGSWLQEGVAVYIEELWQERSAAEKFAPELRGGRHLKLREFMALESLVAEDDPKGGARTAGRLYDQAGAFYEFLRRGPLAKDAERLVARLATTPAAAKATPALVERVFGRSVEDLEKEWVAWGSKPPKAK